MLTRRELLKHAAVLTGMTLIAGRGRAGFKKKEPMQIGACYQPQKTRFILIG